MTTPTDYARQLARAYFEQRTKEAQAYHRQREAEERRKAEETWQNALAIEPRLTNFTPTLTDHDGLPAILLEGFAPIRLIVRRRGAPEANIAYLIPWHGRHDWVFESPYIAETLEEALAIAKERGDKAVLEEESPDQSAPRKHCPFINGECLQHECVLWDSTYSGGDGCAFSLIANSLDAAVPRQI